MNAFITGSEAYGQPNFNSDVDLVIRVDSDTAKRIRCLSDGMKYVPGNTNPVVRFGRLNLILCETDEEYAVWRLGTTELIKKSTPTAKEQARQVFRELRARVDVPEIEQS
jgi:hypothetical protein